MRHRLKILRARTSRHRMSDAEHRLWRVLRHRQLLGFKFRRQVPIGPYIADFACLESALVVEVDGSQHGVCSTDPIREDFLRRHGFRVLRIWNHDVLENIQGVREVIESLLARG